jgi:UDP-glucose 4-epimerase
VAQRTALVTGGAGFIGSHLSERLLEQGWDVYALDDLSTGSETNVFHLSQNPSFHLTVESVLSSAVVSELVHRCDVVYHLAAAVGVRLIVERPGHTLLTNVRGTENVIEYASRFGKPILITSSSEVYGDHRAEDLPLAEDARRVYGPTTAKRWAYADSKAMDEFLALARHEEDGLECVIVRLFNTVGPRQSGDYGNVIPRFVQAALAGEPLEIHGDGSQTRCFCHVDDTVRGLLSLLEAPGAVGEVFNVGSTESVTILELAERILRLTGSSSELVFVPYEEVYGHGVEEMFQRMPAIEKIKATTGWKPTITLDEILTQVVEHARSRAPA